MTQLAALRATSFGASALLLGLAVMAALTMTYTIQSSLPDNGPPIVPIVSHEPPPPTPPPPEPLSQPRPLSEIGAMESEALPPLEFTDTPTATIGAFVPSVVQISNPRWLRQPRDLERYYPRRALAAGIEGEVALDCRVLLDGALNCNVISETPAEWGFGAAALRIAGDHRMRPALRDGVPTEGRYRMRVPFYLSR